MALIREWIMEDLGLKLLALGGALALWAYVSLQPEAQRTLEAQLDYAHVPTGLEINPDEVDRLTVVVSGTKDRLDALSSRIAAQIDLSEIYGPGECTSTVTAEQLDLPQGLRLVKAVPSQVRLVLEKRMSRPLAVEPHFSGVVELGYALDSFHVEPRQLVVAGPESRVALLGQVSTDSIDLSGVVGRRSFRTMAYVADPYV